MNAFEWYALSKMGENLVTIVNDSHGWVDNGKV